MSKKDALSIVAYVVPTFALGFVWHLVAFGAYYQELAMYRDELTFPLGFAAMFTQAIVYAWAYPRMFSTKADDWLRSAAGFGLAFGSIAWAYSTLAVGAKHIMSSVPGFLAIESGFTVVHFAVVAPLIALVWRDGASR
jgi:hypothetical protein